MSIAPDQQPRVFDVPQPDLDADSVGQLEQAFEAFNQASRTFEDYYRQLERRIEELNLELDRKNRELEANLIEKERVQNYLAMILETISAGVIVINQDGDVQTINRSAREIFDLDGIIPVPVSLAELLPELAQSPEIQHGLRQSQSTNRQFELHLATPASNRQWIDVQIVGADETELPGITGPIVVIHDITEHKRLARQANLNSRLKAMGEVAMNVAHEVRNPLGSIELFSSMLHRELADRPELQRLASHVLTGVKNIDSIVSNILLFARNTQISARDIDPTSLIDSVLLYLESQLSEKSIRVTRRLKTNGQRLLGDPELLRQAFLNIAMNAIQAMGKDGHLEIEAGFRRDVMVFQFFDDGCGISPEIKDSIFNAFFTTRCKGTGLGLAISNSIVSAHQGSIECANRKTGGTVFTVTLPLKQ